MIFKSRVTRQLFLGVMVSSALVLGLAACSNEANLTDLQHIERAKDYQDKGELQASVIELKNALQKNPNNTEARWLLGKTYLLLDNANAAEKELSRARELGIDANAVVVPLGKTLLAQGEAQRVLDEIEVPNGASAEVRASVLAARGEAQRRLGHRDEAQAELSAALEACGTAKCSDAWLALANLEMDKRNVNAAKEWIAKATAADPKNVTVWLYLGDFENALGHQNETLDAYNKAVQLAPGQFRVLYARATALLDNGQMDQAKTDLEALRKLMPKAPALSYIEGRLAIANKDFAKAQSQLEIFLKVNPSHPVANYYLAVAQVAQGHLQQAEERLAQLVTTYPGAQLTRRLLATVQAAIGENDQALKTLDPFMQQNTDNADLLSLIGRIYLQKGDVVSGATYLQRAVEKAPESVQTRMELGKAFEAQGKGDLAVAQFDAILQRDPKSVDAAVMRIMTHVRNKNYDAALQAIDSFKTSQPDSPLPDSLAASVYTAKQDYTRARQALERAASLDPKFTPALTKLAQLDLSQGDTAAARSAYQKVLEQNPNHLESLIALAELDAADRKIDAAVQKLQRAVKAHPESDRPYAELARLYLGGGDALKAITISNDGLRASPNSPRLLEVLGMAQLAGAPATAVATFQRLVEQVPNAASAQLHLATAWARLGNVKETRAALNESLRLRPHQLEAKAALARLELQQNRPDQALKLAGEIRKDFAASPEPDVLEANAYLQQRNFSQAWRAYDQALHKNAPPVVLRDYALSRDLSGDRPVAERLLQDWLAKQPEDAPTRAALGALYLRHNELDKARQTLEAVIKQLPDDPDTLNNLAWIYGQTGGDRKRALQYAERARQLRPHDPLIADTLGWLVFNSGDSRRAGDLLAEAYRQVPGSGGIAYHYASVLVRQGKSKEAKPILEKVLAAGGAFAEKDEVNALLLKIK